MAKSIALSHKQIVAINPYQNSILLSVMVSELVPR